MQRLFLATLVSLTLGGAAAADTSVASPSAGGGGTAAAKRWMEALRADDAAALAKETRFPFRLATSSAKKTCDGVASDAAQLSSLIACLRKDAILTKELGYADDLTYSVVPMEKVPPRLRQATGKPAPIVKTFINGDGVTYGFYLPIGKSATEPAAGVTAFLIQADFPE